MPQLLHITRQVPKTTYDQPCVVAATQAFLEVLRAAGGGEDFPATVPDKDSDVADMACDDESAVALGAALAEASALPDAEGAKSARAAAMQRYLRHAAPDA